MIEAKVLIIGIWLVRSDLVFVSLTGHIVVFAFEGRKPSTKNIGLESVGVELDQVGAIKVSLLMEVSCVLWLFVEVVPM